MRRFLIVFSFCFFSIAAWGDTDSEYDLLLFDMLSMHKAENGRYMVWNECGKRVKNPEERAAEYATAIMASIRDVKKKTGFSVDPSIVRAILYRESSDDECSIGNQEINWLSEKLGHRPEKEELISHVKKWRRLFKNARIHCNKSDERDECISSYSKKNDDHYIGIKGWDIGAAQYRWPTMTLKNRIVVLPGSGDKIKGIDLKELMNYQITIQMLVEDLASHYEVCKGHEHWLYSKWGYKQRKLLPEEAYYAHHHTGPHRWDMKYWKKINRHIEKMRKKRLQASEAQQDTE